MSSIRVRGVGAFCLTLACVLVPASALAGGADYFLKLDGVKGESKDDKHKGEIEIQSFSWGATQMGTGGGTAASKDSAGQADALTDGLMVIRNTDPPPPAAAGASGTSMGAGKVNVQDISLMRGPRQTTSMDGVQVAAGDVDGDGRADVARPTPVSHDLRTNVVARTSAQPAPIKIARPLETGSMTMNMKLPGCAVGTRYRSAVLTTPAGRYALQDVVVASCGGGSAPMEQVTLNYSKVQVRGWDPKKKEAVVGQAR